MWYVSLFLSLLPNHGTGEGFCVDYKGAVVTEFDSYFETPCKECECVLSEDGESIGGCFEIAYDCPCDTPCCELHCKDPDDTTPHLDDVLQVTAINSNFVVIISVSMASVVTIFGILFYLYRRRMTSYARVTRRMYMERQFSLPKPTSPEAPPSYDDIETDSRPGNCVKLPPRYEDIVQSSFSFATLQLHDQTDSLRNQASSSVPPPNVEG